MKATDFRSRRKHRYTPEIEAMKTLKHESFENLDDPKYNWIQVGHEKYNRCMYCTNTKVKRTQTMGEFYGAGVVD